MLLSASSNNYMHDIGSHIFSGPARPLFHHPLLLYEQAYRWRSRQRERKSNGGNYLLPWDSESRRDRMMALGQKV
jgi:hypothetical protein